MSLRLTGQDHPAAPTVAVGPFHALGAAIAFGISVEHWGFVPMHSPC